MRNWLLLCLFIILCPALYGQAAGATSAGNTYAVVVGISNYQSTGIPQLQFAHRDAQFFANYLHSASGGNVPEENVRLLLNENATYAAIYDALDWLIATAHKDDLVYFYFSGHGDMENTTIYNLGFLLSYNTPRTNYINSALRIEDLNNIANTLSVKINARVVLITDACHSGKLSGSDNRGTFLVGEQLRTVQNKEIRISSCAPDQLSAEDEGWGGGRGVFSYYLVNGMQGLADRNQDKTITVDEIRSYLDSSLAADALLAEKLMKQSPVIKGMNLFPLAKVDLTSFASLQKTVMTVKAAMPMRLTALPPQPQTVFFNFFQKEHPEEWLDFAALNKFSSDSIPFACLQMLKDSMIARNQRQDENQVEIPKDSFSILINTLQQNKDAFARFRDKLAVMLSDRGQEVINQYLDGDAAELERRRYYNSNSNGYDVYPEMFAVAIKLTAPQNYLSQILQVKLHYFRGVAARLKIPSVENAAPLMSLAFAEQKKAFALEENAAYIQNELGVLSLLKWDLTAAQKYFQRATEIAPKWAIPWSNLAGLYSQLKQHEKATAASSRAFELQPDFAGSYITGGYEYERTGKLLHAEELYRKSINLNSRDYVPFERLGFLTLKTTRYSMADSLFYEADLRKKGFHFHDHAQRYALSPSSFAEAVNMLCDFNNLDVGPQDIAGHYALATSAMRMGDSDRAEREFKTVIALDPKSPLAFHWLGTLLYWQNRYEEGNIIFKYAMDYYLDSSDFAQYVDSVAKATPTTKSKGCFIEILRNTAYFRKEDFYYAGRMYERWNHFAEAESAYRRIIALDPAATGGYYLLWNLYEKMGRFPEAESTIRLYSKVDLNASRRELASFFDRMTKRFPEEGEWFYRAGRLYYDIAAENPGAFRYDEKKIDADTHREHFVIVRYVPPADEPTQLPDINEPMLLPKHIDNPFSDGITNLKMADSLLANDDDALADINDKLGDLHRWQGLSVKAPAYYQKSVALKPDNANIRLKLIDIYDEEYEYTKGSEQLDSLFLRREINFDKQLLLAKYRMQDSRFDEARKLLDSAQQIHPYKLPELAELNGRLQQLAGNWQAAIRAYKSYLALRPGDGAAMYSMARVYALLGNKNEAIDWLQKAMEHGFRYAWVLKNDDAWNKFRKQERWIALQKKYPAKQYELPIENY